MMSRLLNLLRKGKPGPAELRRMEENTEEELGRAEPKFAFYINTFLNLDEFWPQIVSEGASITLSEEEKCKIVEGRLPHVDPDLHRIHQDFVRATDLLRDYQSDTGVGLHFGYLTEAYALAKKVNRSLDRLRKRREREMKLKYTEEPGRLLQ